MSDEAFLNSVTAKASEWNDEALMRRDKAPQRRTHHTAAAATTTWDLSSPSSAFLEQGTVDGGERETALGTYDERWEEREEAEVLDDNWTDELPPQDPELEDQFGSLEAAAMKLAARSTYR